MRSLFWKIFLSFWLAMLALTIAVAWSSYQLRDIENNVMSKAYMTFARNTRSAVSILHQQGVKELKQWLHDPDHRKAMTLYLVSFDGRQVLGEPVPGRILQLAEGNFLDPFNRQPQWLFSDIIRPPGDMPYRLITTFDRPHPLEMLFTPARISIALLISGFVCFFLARHITKPISRLRHATQKLSQGNLSVRIGAELGRRHDELANLARDFDAMAEQLQGLLTSQHRLIRDISHELRSPLTRLQVALELAHQHSGGAVENELKRIENEAERLNELIGQVLALARMEAGVRELDKRPVRLQELIEQIVDDARYEAQSHERQINLLAGTPCDLPADEALLHSAIENIVRNALKYTAANTAVELSLEKHEQTCVLRIRDHGPGIPEDQLGNIFKPFVRVSEARDRDSGGHGLGLAIAERAIRLHDGEIRASNAEDGGLVIEVTLPLA